MRSKIFSRILPILLAFWSGSSAETLPAYAQQHDHAGYGSTTLEVATDKNKTVPSTVTKERGWPEPVDDDMLRGFLLFDNFEYQVTDGPNALRWDLLGWYGGDTNRLWFKSEGRSAFAPSEERSELELQALYGRLISPFFDLQGGIRVDPRLESEGNPDRIYAVLGLQGLAPYQFEVEPTIFFSERGQLVGRFTGTYDILFSQRLILQPRVESNISSKEDKGIGVGSGYNDLELGLRLRYEFRRRFAPYIGVTWKESFGETEKLKQDEGGDKGHFAAVTGIRLWF